MSLNDKYAEWFRKLLPAPFTIAILLTILTFIMSVFLGDKLPKNDIVISEKPGIFTLVSPSLKTEWIFTENGVQKKESKDSFVWKVDSGITEVRAILKENGNSYVSIEDFTLDGSVKIVSKDNSVNKSIQLLNHWYEGMWGQGYLAFAFQMMLMLLLGHVLALSKPVDKFLNKITPICKSTAEAAMYVTFFTVIVSLFNWGLGLIFGAVFARKVGEYAMQMNMAINYPLIGAAGYSGLMVWHGGISGSSLIKISEPGHLATLVTNKETLSKLPDVIPFTETVFSSMNVVVSTCLIVLLPLGMFWLGKKVKSSELVLYNVNTKNKVAENKNFVGAEKLDHANWLAYVLGIGFVMFAFYKAYVHPGLSELKFIDPNYINFILLGLVLLFHGSLFNVLKGVDQAIGGVSGILLQFPLYFGIMGVMNNSGLIGEIASFFSVNSNETTYPLFTFFSAGIVNIFVPSGGGQWMVQGPIILQSAVDIGVSVPKSILALAYGDQVTNMLQPFWALPLLGITGLKAKEILPYTLFLMLMGTVIFITCLLLF